MTAEQRAQEHELAEAKAYEELREMEGSIDGAHFLEKHGAQTTLQSQMERLQSGKNPTTGEIERYTKGKKRENLKFLLRQHTS